MSIQSDIVTALANVASGKVYPGIAPQDAGAPFIIYKRIGHEPEMTLNAYAGTTKSTFVFECWAPTKAAALTLADSVRTALEASATLVGFRDVADAEQYSSEVDEFMEPVFHSFWHV